MKTHDLLRHRRSYRNHTADMGVELGVPDLHVQEGNAGLVPQWMERQLLDIEQISEGDASDASAGVDEVQASRPIVALDEENKDMHFLPMADGFSGIMHLCNDLARETHQALPAWKGFIVQLK